MPAVASIRINRTGVATRPARVRSTAQNCRYEYAIALGGQPMTSSMAKEVAQARPRASTRGSTPSSWASGITIGRMRAAAATLAMALVTRAPKTQTPPSSTSHPLFSTSGKNRWAKYLAAPEEAMARPRLMPPPRMKSAVPHSRFSWMSRQLRAPTRTRTAGEDKGEADHAGPCALGDGVAEAYGEFGLLCCERSFLDLRDPASTSVRPARTPIPRRCT